MYDNKVRDWLSLGKTAGEFGVEIEMEFTSSFPYEPMEKLINSGWKVESDGSLRGPSAELVMNQPLDKEGCLKSIMGAKKILDSHGMIIKDSIRAGVHIHMNMQEETIATVLRLLLLYYPLETVILNKCGDNRQGNLFCLRGRDASYIFEVMRSAIQNDDIHVMRSNDLRYTSMNFQSLYTYGSLEFRALATKPDLSNISLWIEVMSRLKEHAKSVKNSWDNLIRISGDGPKNYFTSVLGNDLAEYFYYDEMERDIMYDVRNVQHLCNLAGMKGI